MKLSCFEFTKTHLHLQLKEFLPSAVTAQQRTATSAELCFPLSSPAALTENIISVGIVPQLQEELPVPPAVGAGAHGRSFLLPLDISFQEHEPSRRVPGSRELSLIDRFFFPDFSWIFCQISLGIFLEFCCIFVDFFLFFPFSPRFFLYFSLTFPDFLQILPRYFPKIFPAFFPTLPPDCSTIFPRSFPDFT